MPIPMAVVSIRMVGRGGQGIKSAAHIIGTAAFLGGHYVQDQPIYGAERRGAPVTAFVRISDEPILERGHLSSPSLLAIADDSLLDDSTIDLIADVTDKTVIFLNTSKSTQQIRSKYGIDHVLVVADLSELAVKVMGNNAMVSVALAGAIGRLLGQDFKDLGQSLDLELKSIRVGGQELERNVHLAQKAFNLAEPIEISEGAINRHAKPAACIELQYHDPKISTCTIVSPGNTRTRRVGDWSNFKPLIDLDKCTKCMICFVYCPDSAITIDSDSKYPIVDFGACKGCNICFTECPPKAITLERRRKE
jgi:pyruvate ferredoxin oxidoreductase gamma subunit